MERRNKVLTKEQIKEAIDLYNSGKNTVYLGKKYGVNAGSIRMLFKRRGVNLRDMSLSHRKFSISEGCFDNLVFQSQYYFLGLLFADGTNNLKKGAVSLRLKKDDIDTLEMFRRFINYKRPLYLIKSKNKKHSDQYEVAVYNKHISSVLNKLGMIPNKSTILSFPDYIPVSKLSHFIRGYFDGDGSLGIVSKTQGFWVSIVSSENFIQRLKLIISKKLKINTYTYKKGNSMTLSISGSRQILKFLKWIYRDAICFMERKHNRYLKMLEIQSKKRGYHI